jgi:polyisoprenoid-binding protein YceI
MSTLTQAPARTTTWAIDPSHTEIGFTIKHMMVARVRGRFAGVDGNIVVDEQNLTHSKVEAEIDVASIDTRDEKRDAHLRSGDFFDVENYPKMTFRSTDIRPRSGDRFVLVGDLTIRGTTRQVEIDVERTGTGKSPFGTEVAGFEGHATISRQDFGLTWNVALETGGVLVGDDVKIELNVEAIRQ